MQAFIFIGSVLPDSTRISSPQVGVRLEAGADYPSGMVSVEIADNRVIGRFDCNVDLSDSGCATVRNVVQDIASSICDSAAILRGAWTIVTIDSCIGPNDSFRMRFSNSSHNLKVAFQEHGVTADDIIAINLHPKGFHLRLALDDLNLGLMEGKFMRSHFYRAIESLRNSVCQSESLPDRAAQWAWFRNKLQIERQDIAAITNHAERHADYMLAAPMSASQVDDLLVIIARILSKYVRWYMVTYTPCGYGDSSPKLGCA